MGKFSVKEIKKSHYEFIAQLSRFYYLCDDLRNNKIILLFLKTLYIVFIYK